MDAFRVPALVVSNPAGCEAYVVLRDSRLRGTDLNAADSVVRTINQNPDVTSLVVDVVGSEIEDDSSGESDGAVRIGGTEFRCIRSTIRGGVGVAADQRSEVALRNSQVDALSLALWLRNGSEGSAMWSELIAGSDEIEGVGVMADAGTQMVLVRSWVEGQGTGPGAVGIRCAAADAAGPTMFIVGGGAMGGSRALVAEGGVCAALNASLVTMSGVPVEVRRTSAEPNVQFHACQLMRLAPASGPALLLSGSPAPVPTVANSYLSAPGAAVAVAMESALSGQIRLLNSVLSTNLQAGVTIVPAASLGYGNYVP